MPLYCARQIKRNLMPAAFPICVFIWFALEANVKKDSDVEEHLRAKHGLPLNLTVLAQLHNATAQVLSQVKGPLTADDPKALWLLRTYYLFPPDGLPYNLREDTDATMLSYTHYKQKSPSWAFIDHILHDLFSKQPPGFFLEAGALDGEFLSNTLQLERRYGWTGLLVEAERESYLALRDKHRHAWSSPACLATKPFQHTAVLTTFREQVSKAQWWQRGAARIEKDPLYDGNGPGYKNFQAVQCFPLLSFILALNVSTVNFISLDVEGAEMSVLTNFPFEQVNVEVWAIEHTRNITGESSWSNSFTNTSTAQTDGSSNAASFEDPNLIDFMEKRGYYLFDIFCYFIPDYIFVKRNSDLFRRLAVPQKLWKRRGLCLHKTPWTGGKTFNASKYRDSRHWPRLEFSPDGKE